MNETTPLIGQSSGNGKQTDIVNITCLDCGKVFIKPKKQGHGGIKYCDHCKILLKQVIRQVRYNLEKDINRKHLNCIECKTPLRLFKGAHKYCPACADKILKIRIKKRTVAMAHKDRTYNKLSEQEQLKLMMRYYHEYDTINPPNKTTKWKPSLKKNKMETERIVP